MGVASNVHVQETLRVVRQPDVLQGGPE